MTQFLYSALTRARIPLLRLYQCGTPLRQLALWRLRAVSALLVWAGLCLCTTPSFAALGPTIHSDYVYGNDYSSSTFASSSAAISDLVDRQNASAGTCNAFIYRQTNWQASGYPVVIIEGVEARGQMSVNIGYYVGTHCDILRTNPTVAISRVRIVCSSMQKFLADGKCHDLDKVNKPGIDPANLGATNSHVGDPINTATGNMWKTQLDYAAAAPASGLSLERTYNSTYPAGDSPQGSFGGNWSHSYGSRLTRQSASSSSTSITCYVVRDTGEEFCLAPDADTSPLPAAVTVSRPNGQQPLFNRQGLTWVGNSSTSDRVVPVLSTDSSTVLAWDFYTADGDTTERYDITGTLIAITQRNGRVQTLTYSTGTVNDTSLARYPSFAPACTIVDPGPLLPAGRLLCVTDNWGRQLQFKYDTSGRIVEAIAPDVRSTLYEYDGPSGGCVAGAPTTACTANNLTKVTYADGKSRTYVYNEAALINNGAACTGLPALGTGLGPLKNAMTGYIDENGVRHLTWRYDCSARAIASEMGGGANKVELSFGATSTAVYHYLGDPAAFDLSSRTFTTTVVNGVVLNTGVNQACVECGTVLTRTFDANGNVVTSKDFNNVLTTYSYDMARNLELARTEASGTAQARTITTSWHPVLRLPLAIAAPLRLMSWTYDANGNVLTRSEQATSDQSGAQGLSATLVGVARTWTYTYDAAGLLSTVTGPRTDVVDRVTYTYDSGGNLDTAVNAAGHLTTFSNYDAHGHVGRIVAPNGSATDFTYTPRGWLATRTVTADGASETNTYDFDAAGQLSKVTQPDGSSISYEYDAAHRLVTVRDSAGNSVHYTLGLTGTRIREEVSDPNGTLARRITRVYDTFNRLQTQTGAAQ